MVTSTTVVSATTTTVTTDTITTIPMTTLFTPPASCSSSWTYEPEAANDVENGLLMQNCVKGGTNDTQCYPSGFSHFGRLLASEVFSPGHCPVGYTSAALSISGSVTGAECCLSDFAWYSESPYYGCTSMLPSSSSMIVPIRQEPDESTEVTGPITMWGQPISVLWESSDLKLFEVATTATNTTQTTSTAASTISSTSTTTSTSTKPTITSQIEGSGSAYSSSATSLSTGAQAGIGVGVGIAGVALLAALGFYFLRRRKGRQDAPLTGDMQARVPPNQSYRPSELDGYAADRHKHFPELEGS